MAWETVTFGDRLVAGSAAFRVKEGTYLFTIAKVEGTPEDFAKKHHITVSMVVTKGPDGIGRTYQHRMYLGENSHYQLANFLVALGIPLEQVRGVTLDSWAKFNAFCNQLNTATAKKTIGALVADDEYVNDQQNTVTTSKAVELFPGREYDTRAAASAVTAPPAAAVAAAPAFAVAAAAPAQQAASAPATTATPAPAVADDNSDIANIFAAAGLNQ